MAGEDFNAEFVLQLDDRLRDPRLARKQRLGRFGEVEVLPHSLADEAELVQVHI
ncbi:hypothetical protein OKW32_003085 [Paraburkholderia youngii]